MSTTNFCEAVNGRPDLVELRLSQEPITVLPDGRMDRKNAARYLGLSVQTLANMVVQKKGPRSVRVGGRVWYFKADLDAYVAEKGQ